MILAKHLEQQAGELMTEQNRKYIKKEVGKFLSEISKPRDRQ
jgi:hypothetical protein